MRLYTQPRALHPYLTRRGDLIALHKSSSKKPITSEVDHVDAELRGTVLWGAVNAWEDSPVDMGALRKTRVYHTYGAHDVISTGLVIVREAVEIDAHFCLTAAPPRNG